MSKLHHHPADDTLMSYAAGTLDAAFSLVLSCHLQFCGRCLRTLRIMEDMGGLLLENVAPASGDIAFFERTMQRFAQEVAQKHGNQNTAGALDAGNEVIMPAPLARLTGLRRETIPWMPVSQDLKRFDLPAQPGAKASAHIINIAPGAVLPTEKNGGQLVLVLWGYYDYDGGHFERGDLHDITAGGFKGFRAGNPEGVIFLTAIQPVQQIEILRTAH